MKRTFYILLGIVFFSCGGKKPTNDKEVGYRVIKFYVPFDEIKRDMRSRAWTWEAAIMDSSIMHDKIIKTYLGTEKVDSQYMYMVCRPNINLKHILKHAPSHKIEDFNYEPSIDYWEDPNALQLHFAHQLWNDFIQMGSCYFLSGYKISEQCDYIFYRRSGVCVGWDYWCLSLDKKGNIIDGALLLWDSSYDGGYSVGILEKLNDSTYVQIDQYGDDYTNPKKGKLWQYELNKTEITFHANGMIDDKITSRDTIPKSAKKIGEPL